jgi:hypothetical protein
MAQDVRSQLDKALIGGRRRRRTQNLPFEDSNNGVRQSNSPSLSPETTIVLPTPLVITPALDAGAISSYDVYSPNVSDIRSSLIGPSHGGGLTNSANSADGQKTARGVSSPLMIADKNTDPSATVFSVR